MTTTFIHHLADVQSIHIGVGSTVWQFVVVLPNARIGTDCNICSHCFIENDVVIGNRVTIKNGVQLWDGLRVGDDVFIGPNVTFTNDRFPRIRQQPVHFPATIINHGAPIGGGDGVATGHNRWRTRDGWGRRRRNAVGAGFRGSRRQSRARHPHVGTGA